MYNIKAYTKHAHTHTDTPMSEEERSAKKRQIHFEAQVSGSERAREDKVIWYAICAVSMLQNLHSALSWRCCRLVGVAFVAVADAIFESQITVVRNAAGPEKY